jgi:hypothetical protein
LDCLIAVVWVVLCCVVGCVVRAMTCWKRSDMIELSHVHLYRFSVAHSLEHVCLFEINKSFIGLCVLRNENA